ncbi:MAG TPA: lamin tail domain-containing protein, partial [Verrucomicrobiae bacterium]|nr:lamin tail domain-containing protein [Verrucomicrobiae bacterium]
AADITPPTIQSVSPVAGAIVSNLTQVIVTFSEAVTGLEIDDFLINGASAAARSSAGNAWTIQFTQPSPGLVQFTWDASHAIYDLAGNRFDENAAGATWSCTLVDTIPPVVRVTEPARGAVVAALTQIQLTFSEAVNGVDAADLRVNGVSASSVTGGGAGPYLYSFPQPASGLVTMSWAGGHGIADTAPVPNAFAGGSWTYTLNPAFTADVVINEIVADNLTGIRDEDGDKADWIELFNRGNNSVSLLGWSLTDDPANPGQWVFPAITLAAGQYLLVFADGKDRATTGPLTNHTSFALGTSEYLGLYNAQLPRQVVHEFAPDYPEQRGDKSWGRTSSNTFAYLATPTPRALNSEPTNYSGFVALPHASVNSGLFQQAFQVALACATPGASIYYTLNGDMPTPANGSLYTGLIPIAGTSNKAVIPLRAAAYKSGLLESSVLTRTYVFPDQVLFQPIRPAGFPTNWVSEYPGATADTSGDYEMDPQVLTSGANLQIARQALAQLPTVSLVTPIDTAFGPTNGVYSGRKKQGNQRPVNAEMWLPNGERVFQSDCGFEIQGGSSPTDASGDWKDKKLSMRLIFKGDFGTPKLHAKVFDDTPVEEFDTLILDAGLNFWWTHMTDGDQRNRAKFITDTITSDLMNNAGMVAQHARYVHLYLDGLYWGLYFLHERMDEAAAASYLGGQKEEWDVFKHTGDASGLQNGTVSNYNAMLAVARSGLANNANYEQLQAWLDVPWFNDYMIVNFWVGNTDWPHHNFYAWRRSRLPGSLPWRFVSWDAEHTFRQWDFAFLANANLNAANSPGELFRLLTNNVEYRVLFGDRIHKLMFNGGPLYTTPNTAAFWSPANPAVNLPATAYRKRTDEIWDSVVCESARWGDVATVRANQPYTRELEYTRELNALFTITNISGQTPNFFPLRGSNVLAQFRIAGLYPAVAAPVFSQHGGHVAPGYSLFITNAEGAGTVYFSTNGSDPRVYGSGAVSAQAAAYAGGPVPLGRSSTVRARTLNGGNWSALNEADFLVGFLGVPLRITEIMYNPQGGSAYEFIELRNIGLTELNLGGCSFEGITFVFPPQFMLAAGARLVLANDNDANPAAFAARYPGVVVAGYFADNLSNGGERLALKDAAGNTVISVNYDDENGWPTAADGAGASLEILDENGDPDDPANWRASAAPNGTPGQAPGAPPAPVLVLNELMALNLSTTNNGGAYPDWVELYNPGPNDVSLTGWSLSDNGDARRFVFNSGPVLSAGAYLVVWCDTNIAAPGLHTGFALDKDGSSLFLYDGSTNRVDAISFGPQLADYSIGRISGVWTLNVPSPGAANLAAPTISATNLAINEWLANTAPGGSDWVELYNRSATLPAELKGAFLGTSNAVFRYSLPAFIAPSGYLQLLADEAPGAKHLDFKLSAAGGAIVLYDAAGVEVTRATYGAQVEGVTQGRLPDASATIVSFPGSASPGAANYVLNYGGPFLNEVLARNDTTGFSPWGTLADWIELRNTNAGTFDFSGMGLGDSPGAPKFIFPAGAQMMPDSYLRIWCDGLAAASVSPGLSMNCGFSISAQGGGLYLFGTNGQIMNFVEYGVQVADQSIGLSGGQWRLLAAPTPAGANAAPATLGPPSALRINEWMANPARGNDWFELFNSNAQPVDLAGLYLTDDPSITGLNRFQIAPLSFVGAKGFVRFTADGDPSQGKDHVSFNLDAFGETLRLYASNGTMIDSVDFGFQPLGVSQGRLPDGATSFVTFLTSPTPGEPNYLPLSTVAISEVLSHTDPPLEDAVELANSSGADVDIGGWFLSDSLANLKKYRFANGTSVGANGFRVFYEYQFGANVDPGALVPFTFDSARGDLAILSQVDGSGNLTGYRSQFKFGASSNGVSFGRVLTSVGEELAAASGRSFGSDSPATLAQFRSGAGSNNPPPLIGPVVINELMFHPVSGEVENEDEEFVELCNLTTNAVRLYDASFPSNRWRLAGGVDFVFPSSTMMPSRSYLLVVAFDPQLNPAALANFRAKYGVPQTVPIRGPYSGKLDNAGDIVELFRPDAPQMSGPDAGYVPQICVDRVEYDDASPWPAGADGTGASLQRRRPNRYGNEPLSWKAEPPTAGRPNVPGSTYTDADADGLPDDWETGHGLSSSNIADADADPDGDGRSSLDEYFDGTDPQLASSRLDTPVITMQPQNATAPGGTTTNFSVSASGTAPLRYQWRFNGLPLSEATNQTLTLSVLQSTDSGAYSVMVLNDAGFALSRDARLLVLVPPTISVQPMQQVVLPGATVTFMVGASGTGVVRYQWLVNGTPIAGATTASFTMNNVSLGSEGAYSVLVTDDVTTLQSQEARLIVKVAPIILIPPVGQTNRVGANATYTVRVSGSVPMTYFWRRMSFAVATNITFSTNDSFTLTNLQLAQSAFYRLVVTNYATLAGTNVIFTNAVWTVPAITSDPTNRIAVAGSDTTFTVAAAGTNLAYQWRFMETNLPGATSSNLTLANIQPAQAGSYAAVVTNLVGAATSQVATLTVWLRPVLTEPEVLPNGLFRFKLMGYSNQTYFIEASTNLVDWPTLTNLLTTNGIMPFTDALSPGATNRFYRARFAP